MAMHDGGVFAQDLEDRQVGWYGKLPAAGDFLFRRMPRDVQAWWDRWTQNGLSAFRHWPEGMTRHYAVAPVWNFAIPASLGVPAVQLGCLAPSCDRVGRYYPVFASLQIAPERYSAALLERAASWYWQCGTALLQAIRHSVPADQLDEHILAAAHGGFAPRPEASASDILSILTPKEGADDRQWRLGWAELPMCFDALGPTSYWWTNRCDGSPLRTTVHAGGLNTPLFSTLFSHGQMPGV